MVLTVSVASSSAAPQPNIVHILTDDLGWMDPACYYRAVHGKESVYETPNMDRLAKNGKRFMQAYAPAPTCSPSRAAYMAGLAVGTWPDVAALEGHRAVDRVFEPSMDAETRRRHQESPS